MQIESSLPVAISEAWRCVAWAPIVPITDEVANKLDADIRQYLSLAPGASMDDYFASGNELDAYKRLYCRYGLS